MRAYTKVMADGEVVVKVQLTKKQVEKICWYFGTKDFPIFTSCEFLAQGYGWFIISTKNGDVAGAAKGLRHVNVALAATKTRKQIVDASKVEAQIKIRGRAIVRVRKNHGHTVFTVVSRKVSAEANKEKESMAEIAALLERACAQATLAEKVARFNSKFHH